MEPTTRNQKKDFIRQNILKTAVYLLVVIGVILAGRHFFKDEMESLIDIARNNLAVFYIVFFLFEILPGQLPPEIFFVIYSKDTTPFPAFLGVVSFLACLSYVALILSYYIGTGFSRINFFNGHYRPWFEKRREQVIQYGSVIIVLAMFTPLPSAVVSMTAGYLNFPLRKFAVLALARFIRFFVYGAIIYFLT